jgi:plasmid stabilization system protein ParE
MLKRPTLLFTGNSAPALLVLRHEYAPQSDTVTASRPNSKPFWTMAWTNSAPGVAGITLRRIEHSLKITLAQQPYLGRLLPERQVYRYVIPRTPFVAYYHVDAATDQITIVAFFYGAQDRAEFEAD